MSSSAANPVWLLAWATLGIVLLIAIVMLVRSRRRDGAHPMKGKRTRSIDEIRDQHDRR